MAQSSAILGCGGHALTPDERAFFADAQPWGFILFARNIATPDQVLALCSDLRACVGRDAPILIDQEGGRVQRMRAPHWREWHPALDQMARMPVLPQAARAMYLRYRLIAHELRAVGIDANCAPLADIARDDTHRVLHNRLYGSDLDTVTTIARAVAQAHLDGGVLPVLKHLPGYGRGRVDSHLDLPIVSATRAELDQTDFAAFKPLADLPMGMTAHIVFDHIAPNEPATLSPDMMALIRRDIGFDGLLMTDDISMGALRGSIADRTAQALQAGCDMILHCNGNMDEMKAVMAHCAPVAGRIKSRADGALVRRVAPDTIDIKAIEAELFDLLQGRVYV
jgi:beta-N-acetylhexosaminidase